MPTYPLKKNYLHGQILLAQCDVNLNRGVDTFVGMVLHGCPHCILKYSRITLKHRLFLKKKATTYNFETYVHYLNFKFSLSLV